MRTVATALLAFLVSASAVLAQEGKVAFTVVHKPPLGQPLKDPPFRFMHYYRTEVRNTSDRPLKIVWFEGYMYADGVWYPGNVLGRVLRGDEFSAWYTEGDPILAGVIPPGATAVCDVNWHASDTPGPAISKWAFIAVDTSGNDYYVEAVVDPSVVRVVESNPRATVR